MESSLDQSLSSIATRSDSAREGKAVGTTLIDRRNNKIAMMAIYDYELSLQEIADRIGISKQRVSQILKELDIDRGIINQRKRNRERQFQEGLRAKWSARIKTVLSDGTIRPEFRVYMNMRRRCLDSNNPNYPRYGGRGITICERWLDRDGFRNFYKDLGPRPEGKYANGRAMYSIERIDNDGNYEPGNCKWATQAEQCRNRRKRQRKDKAVGIGSSSAMVERSGPDYQPPSFN